MLIVTEPRSDSEHQRQGHPERPDRVAAALAGVADLHLGSDLEVVPARAADRAELSRVHAPGYLDELAAFCLEGGGDLDPDTYATAGSWEAACLAAGAGLAAIEALHRRDEGVAFVTTRPPGHHALHDRAMGFCLLNNIAVAAAELTANGERVLIVDWDVHHGNGTQAIFWDDPNVLYVSTHEWPLFPGTGAAREVGGRHATGRTVNLPLPSGATGDVVRQALDVVAVPVIDEFKPTWVLVSAGFDAHRADPLAGLALSSGDFADLARVVADFAPSPGRLVLFLEGGYDLAALRGSVTATLSALLGGDHQPEDPTSGGPGREMVNQDRAARIAELRRSDQLILPKGTPL
jgi:acetoin utilization deacetylase AcuC-like enzyme